MLHRFAWPGTKRCDLGPKRCNIRLLPEKSRA